MLIALHRHCQVYPRINHAFSKYRNSAKAKAKTLEVWKGKTVRISPHPPPGRRCATASRQTMLPADAYEHLFGKCRRVHHFILKASLSNLFNRSRLPGLSELRSSALVTHHKFTGQHWAAIEQQQHSMDAAFRHVWCARRNKTTQPKLKAPGQKLGTEIHGNCRPLEGLPHLLWMRTPGAL